MKKIGKITAFLSALFLSATFFGGCNDERAEVKSIQSIVKTGSEGLTDYYTITYTDGTTDGFTIQNGDVSVEELYARYLEDYPNGTYEDFLQNVLCVSVDETTTAIHKALKSSLKVYTEFTESGFMPPYGMITDTAVYTGSAVIYSIESDYTYLITNYHVIYDTNANTSEKTAERIVCYLYGSEGEPHAMSTTSGGYTVYDYGEYGIECEYVGGCATADIALIKTKTSDIKAINGDIDEIEFADGYSVGQTAIAIGNPSGEGISVTKGIVSVDNEVISLSVDGTIRDYRSIRMDTALYGGNSGGGLFDVNGKLIGIANAGANEEENINYAVPLSIVKNVAESIMDYAKEGKRSIKKVAIGVTVRSENSKYVYDATQGVGKIVEDVIIQSVKENSIVAQLGLKQEDRILSFKINGTEYAIERYFNIDDILYIVREGDEISVGYKRGNEQKQTGTYEVKATDLITVA